MCSETYRVRESCETFRNLPKFRETAHRFALRLPYRYPQVIFWSRLTPQCFSEVILMLFSVFKPRNRPINNENTPGGVTLDFGTYEQDYVCTPGRGSHRLQPPRGQLGARDGASSPLSSHPTCTGCSTRSQRRCCTSSSAARAPEGARPRTCSLRTASPRSKPTYTCLCPS